VVDQRQRLMEADDAGRAALFDQSVEGAGLRLGEGARAAGPAPAEVSRGEVPVQIDAADVAAGVVPATVGVGVRNQDDGPAREEMRVRLQVGAEALEEGRPDRLVPVNRGEEKDDVMSVIGSLWTITFQGGARRVSSSTSTSPTVFGSGAMPRG